MGLIMVVQIHRRTAQSFTLIEGPLIMARDRFRGMGEAIPKKSRFDIINSFRDVIEDFKRSAEEVDALRDGPEETVLPVGRTPKSVYSWE